MPKEVSDWLCLAHVLILSQLLLLGWVVCLGHLHIRAKPHQMRKESLKKVGQSAELTKLHPLSTIYSPEHIVYLLVCSFILALIFEAPLGTSFPSCSPINAHFGSSISFPWRPPLPLPRSHPVPDVVHSWERSPMEPTTVSAKPSSGPVPRRCSELFGDWGTEQTWIITVNNGNK